MRTRHLALAAVTVALCLLFFVAGSADIGIDVTPRPVGRGTDVLLRLDVVNDSGESIDLPTLSAPLPTGIDQWRTEVRVDGGVWTGYPANGLIGLSPLAENAKCIVEIRAAVETGAPDKLTFSIDLLTPTGVALSGTNTVNVLPSVDAGPDLVSVLGAFILLSGSSAHDGAAALASFLWDDGGAGGAFDHSWLLHPTYAPPIGADLVELTLTVTDLDGAISDDSLRLQINAAPTVELGEDRYGVEGDEIDLTGLVSDPDGWIVSVEWTDHGAGGAFFPSAGVIDAIYIAPILPGCDAARIELTLTVTDDRGTQTSDSLFLWLENPADAPTVDAGFDRAVFAGDAVDLVAEILDAGDPIVDTEWTQTDGPEVSLTGGASLAATWLAPTISEETELVFRFTATTICGAGGTDDVTVVVMPGDGADPGDPGDPGEPPDDPDDPDDSGGGGDGDGEAPGTPPDELGSLQVSLELRDSIGFPIDLFSSLRVGQDVQLLISVTNDGPVSLYNLRARVNGGADSSFVRRTLASWETTRATYALTLDASQIENGLDLEVLVLSEDDQGRLVTASERISTLGRSPAAALDLVLRAPIYGASAGEGIDLSLELRNSGVISVEGLVVLNQKGNRIALPRDRLDPGESLYAEFLLTVDCQDEGALEIAMEASGFTSSGTPVSATASLILEIRGVDDPDGGGGWFSETRAPDDGSPEISGSTLARIAFSEIAWAGTAASPDDEWIELVNLTVHPVDLTGWTIVWSPSIAGGPERTISLHGSISGLPYTSAVGGDSSRVSFVRDEATGTWQVINLAWWGADPIGNKGHGFYLVERGDDDTVSGIEANSIYDPERSPWWSLPDEGATLRLIDAQGRVIDIVSASEGWPSGAVGASMERTDPRAGAFTDDWQTNPGILWSGFDRDGRPLRATAGMPNSPSIDSLMARATASIVFRDLAGSGVLIIPCDDSATRPTLRVTAAAAELAAGGGGEVASVPMVRQRWDPRAGLEIGFASLPAGSYFIWIVDEDGARLLPVRISD